MAIASGQFKAEKTARADILITPDLTGISYMSSARNNDAYDSGYVAAIRLIPQIKEMINMKGIK